MGESASAQVPLHDFSHLHTVLRVKSQLVRIRALLLASLEVFLVLSKELSANDLKYQVTREMNIDKKDTSKRGIFETS